VATVTIVVNFNVLEHGVAHFFTGGKTFTVNGTRPLFSGVKSVSNQLIKNYALLLAYCWLLPSLLPTVESAARNAQYTAQGNNFEFA
jgi:hypothetical protein